MTEIDVNKLLNQLKNIANKKSELDKRPHEFGTGIKMYNSEMYLVEVLGVSEGQSMTRIAEIMGITKGAVSQTFKKLEKRGLVKKYPDPVNASRSLLYLTTLGKKILKTHEKWHQEMDGGFSDYLSKLEPSALFVIKDFLSRYEFLLDNRS
ncbi:MAG: MarR family winged helix-turn-helix transcriptional regulator [Spirochaetaceae bacterium]